jgi:hypothetical protein
VEERQLPAVERLEQLSGSIREPSLQIGDEGRPEGVEPGRLARRQLRSHCGHRPYSVRTPVKPLEDDGTGGDGAGGGEAKSTHRPPELGRSVRHLAGRRLELALELEEERAVDFASEVARKKPRSVGPRGGHLPARGGAHAHAPRKLDHPPRGEADERSEGRVGAALAVERALEAGVGGAEGSIVPVEPAARFRGRPEKRDEDRAAKSLVLADPFVGMRAREQASRRLLLESGERFLSVIPVRQPPAALLDEGADEGPVLVQSRPVRARVLLERDGDVGPVLELERELEEGAEAKSAQGAVELR